MKKLILAALLAMSFNAYAGDVTLTWTAPTQNEDGTTLIDLAGFKIYESLVPGGPYTEIVDLADPLAVSYVAVDRLPNTYYYVATAYNTSNVESQYSGEASKVVLPSVPNPPVLD